jgi:hypothetical protein
VRLRPSLTYRPAWKARQAAIALVVALAAVASVVTPAPASVVACGASTVTVAPMHSPDGTTRPFYADFKSGSMKHSGYVGYELAGAPNVLGSDVWIRLSGFAGGSVGVAANQSASIPVRATSQSGKALVYAYLTASAETTAAQSWTVEVWNGKPGQTGSTQVCAAVDGFSKVLDVIDAAANKITSISVSTSAPAIGGSLDVTAVGDTGTMGAGDASDQSGGKGVFSMAPAMDDSWPADSFALTGVGVTIGGTTTRDRLRIYPGTSAAGAYTAVYSFTVRKPAAGTTPVYPVQNIASGTQVKYTGTYPSPIATIAQPVVTTSLVKTTQSLVGPPYAVTYRVVASNGSTSAVVLDYLRDTPTASSWSFATGSAQLNGAAVADPVNDAGTLVFKGPFAVPGASGGVSGTLTFTYTLDVGGTVSNSVVGQVGDVLLGGSSGSENQVTVDPARPTITTASLPDASVGVAYSETLAASAGAPPYTWAISSGSLPPGLALDPVTGEISGLPLGPGSSTFTVSVTDAAAAGGTRSLTLTVGGSAPGDTTAPTGSVSINGGATVTTSQTVALRLTAGDAVGVTRYRTAEGSDCSSASWTDLASTASLDTTTSLELSSGDGSKTVCAQFGDAAGNVSSTATATVTFDTPPTVTLSTPAGEPTSAAFRVTATFEKSVTGFGLADVTIGNGTASSFSGSGTTYSFDVTPAGQGSVTVDVGASAAVDAAGVGNVAAQQLVRTYDSLRPSVLLGSAASDPTSGAFSVTTTFSEAVSGVALADLEVTNGTASNLTGSGTTYSFDVTPSADGTVTVAFGAGAASDAAGNPNTAATSLTRVVDRAAPSVVLASTAPDPTDRAFAVTATFSEAVTGLALADLTVGNGTAANLSGSGTTYSFDVTPSADGTVTVALGAGAATDAAGNPNTAATSLTRTFDGSAPTVQLTSAAPDPTNAAFTVTATFSEPVTGLILGDVAVGGGSASNLQGSGATYAFDVTPTAQGAVTVDIAAGAAADLGGNPSTAAAQLTRTYDSVRPSVALTTAAAATTSAASFLVTATFSEVVTGFALADVSITNGTASGLSGSGTTYTFDVASGADGGVTVTIDAGAAADAAANASTAATPLTRTFASVPPVVTIHEGPAATTTETSASFVFSVDRPATLTCSVDDAPFTPCASPLRLAELGTGEHELVVRGRNAYGAVGTARWTWKVVLPPSLDFTLRPPESSQPDAFFAWSAEDDATFACWLDGVPFEPCTTPVFLDDLPEGPHTFTVRATTPAGGSSSATTTWTVGREAARPPANVAIIPKISPTDMEGRPPAFRQAADTPRSKGPFTRRLNVKLRIPTPPNVGSNVVYISNHPDFRDQQVFLIAADEHYDWDLLAGPSGDRIVYVRFSEAPDAGVGEANIVLDQELPVLTPKFLRIGRTPGNGARPGRAAQTSYCGGAARRWLRIGGRDGFSGLNAVQVASHPDHPCAWRPFLPTFSYRLPGRVIYVRVEDRVGNVSPWYRVRTRR